MQVRRHLLLVLLGIGLLVVAGLWLWWSRAPSVQLPAVELTESVEGDSATARSFVSLPVAQPPFEPVSDGQQGVFDASLGLVPAEVLNNPECRQRPGKGLSSGVTAVVVPTETGSRFSIVDANGTIYSDDLPFSPGRLHVARRKDGSVLTLFEDEEQKEPGLPGPEVREPVRIYLDGQIIFDHHKIWTAQVADDGSSYAFIEPVAGGSRLVIRNLDRGTEHDYDLTDTYYRYESGALSHSLQYSVNNEEVMLKSGFEGGGDTHFFPTSPGAGKRRMVYAPEEEGIIHTEFASSEVGYFSFYLPGTREKYFLARQELKWNREGGEVKDRWVRGGGAVETISQDGSLLLMGRTLLDAATGQTVFDLSSNGNEEQLRRFTHILGPGATAEQLGTAGSAWLVGDELWLHRTLRSDDDGRTRDRVVDVYKLDGIHLDSGPAFRVPVSYPGECAPGDTAYSGLQAHEGRLTYLTTRR